MVTPLPSQGGRFDAHVELRCEHFSEGVERSEGFARALAPGGELIGAGALDTSPHCLAFELSRGTEEPTSFILRIEWSSVEGHLEGFRKSPEFAMFLAAVRPFIPNIREMRHYALTPIVGRKVAPV